MVRPYGIKDRKLKKRRRTEEPPPPPPPEKVEEDEASGDEAAAGRGGEAAGLEDEQRTEEAVNRLPGLPVVPAVDGRKQPGVIFILEKACLEIGKVGKKMQILSSDEHANFLRKRNHDPADYRPDIIHHALLAIFDSPITKAGRLRAVYVRTEKGVLFEIKPHVRMPRTFNRFSGLMSQLLQNLSISAAGKREKLFNIIKNPVTRYLPVASRIIGLSHSSEKLVDLHNYVAASSDDANLVFVVGAMAHGVIERDYVHDFISISDFPLSAACCLNKICCALEHKWNVK